MTERETYKIKYKLTWSSLTIMNESSLSNPTKPGVPILFWTKLNILKLSTSSRVRISYQAFICSI